MVYRAWARLYATGTRVFVSRGNCREMTVAIRVISAHSPGKISQSGRGERREVGLWGKGRRRGSSGGQDSVRGAHIVTAFLSDSLSSPFASQCVAVPVVRKGHNMERGARLTTLGHSGISRHSIGATNLIFSRALVAHTDSSLAFGRMRFTYL